MTQQWTRRPNRCWQQGVETGTDNNYLIDGEKERNYELLDIELKKFHDARSYRSREPVKFFTNPENSVS
jgi:hypothetical protein